MKKQTQAKPKSPRTKRNPKRKINNSMTEARMLPGDIALVRVFNFKNSRVRSRASTNGARDIYFAMALIGQPKALILDLRDAAGDDFETGINATALFLDNGLIWSFREQTKSGISTSEVILVEETAPTAGHFEWISERPDVAQQRSRWKRLPNLCRGIPIVCLVNDKTGGAGQVVAQALTRNQAAGIWGTPSSGLGMPSRFFTMANGKAFTLLSSNTCSRQGKWHAHEVRVGPIIKPEYTKQNTNRDDFELVTFAHVMLLKSLRGEIPTSSSPIKLVPPHLGANAS